MTEGIYSLVLQGVTNPYFRYLIEIDYNNLLINIEKQWKSIGQLFVIIDFIDFCN